MALRSVGEYNVALRGLPVPPVALIEWGLVASTGATCMLPVLGEVGMEAFVWDMDIASEGEGLCDEGGYSSSSE